MCRVDGLGAVVSAVSVGVLRPLVQELIGFPASVLRALGAAAVGFALYSFSRFAQPHPRPSALRVVAGLNLSYCVVTVGLLVAYASELRPLGWAYFLGEVVLVVALSVYELRLARSTNDDGARASVEPR